MTKIVDFLLISSLKNASKLINVKYMPKIFADFSFVVVAERSKASDHFRSFGQKKRWGPGVKNFFFFFLLFSMLYKVNST